MSELRPTVGQIVGKIYLKPSENWIYRQVCALTTVRSIFLAEGRGGDAVFPWEPVYTIDRLSAPRRIANLLVRELTGYFPHHRTSCRRDDVRLLHAHFGVNAARSLSLSRALRVPLLTSFYGRDMYQHREGEPALAQRYRRLFEEGAAFLVEGPAAREQLIRIGCPAERIRVHRLGVDLEAIAVSPRRRSSGEPLRLLMASRFREKKGLEYGVEAFCKLGIEEPRLQLTVVGDAGDSAGEREIARRLREMVARAGLDDRARFAGFLSHGELHALAREHHLFLHPSVQARDGDAEGGHPVVLTEMAASGMAIVATRHCDIPEIVVHRVTGWLCEEHSSDDIVSALREALARPETVTEYGQNGRRLVEEKYDLRRNTLDGIYRDFLPVRH